MAESRSATKSDRLLGHFERATGLKPEILLGKRFNTPSVVRPGESPQDSLPCEQ